MSSASHAARRQYWREAPLLGLTGLAEITVRHGHVATEAVTYDLNMACETLRGCGPQLLKLPSVHVDTPTGAADGRIRDR